MIHLVEGLGRMYPSLMSEKEWAIAYTDGQYLLRSEVVKAMNTTLIDGYWADILAYRKSKSVTLPFKSIANRFFTLTLSEAIKTKINAFELVSARFAGVLKKLVDPKEKEQAERACLLLCLREVSLNENAQMSELSLKALLNGTYQENNPFHAPVIAYRDALYSYLHDPSSAPIRPNDDFLAEALGKCQGVSELTSFYRTTDFDSFAQKARYLYNPDYNYAPHDYIEILMSDFLHWLSHGDEVSYFVKAVAASYYLDYVMPFGERNDEVASLLAKAAFQTSEAGKEAFLFPFEALLVKTARYKALALETQRSGDLTYLVMQAIDTLTPLIDSLSEEIKSIKIETYRSEFNAVSPEEKSAATPAPKQPSAQQLSLFTPNEEKPAEIKPAPAVAEAPKPAPEAPVIVSSPEPAVAPSPVAPTLAPVETPAPMSAPVPVAPLPATETKPMVEEAPKEEPISEPVKEEKPRVVPEKLITPAEMEPSLEKGESALSVEENPLSDKEIKEYTQYLLETNPALNKNQASFLANHCTMGRYYTIQQFKKFTRCAYETARTSMDKLAQERYYTKLQVKNKFVYTPIKKGESKS